MDLYVFSQRISQSPSKPAILQIEMLMIITANQLHQIPSISFYKLQTCTLIQSLHNITSILNKLQEHIKLETYLCASAEFTGCVQKTNSEKHSLPTKNATQETKASNSEKPYFKLVWDLIFHFRIQLISELSMKKSVHRSFYVLYLFRVPFV